ncbi:MAG: DNA polymerase III subunit delta', partial [Actinomycetes bacterium]
MAVWDALVGQSEVVSELRAAVQDAALEPPGSAMTHAWLFTGPPGSGRSSAATAFAAALVCQQQGCGECHDCIGVRAGTHPDVEIVRPEGVSYKTADARALVSRASVAPARSRWHVMVVEDADRLTETANNVLLKAIEEPPPRAVWVLCTPSVEDVLPTIRSRCRQVMLRTPNPDEVARYLTESEGIDPATALFASKAAQGHVGRARALARDDQARQRRQEILSVPSKLADLASCIRAAKEIVDTAEADAQ